MCLIKLYEDSQPYSKVDRVLPLNQPGSDQSIRLEANSRIQQISTLFETSAHVDSI